MYHNVQQQLTLLNEKKKKSTSFTDNRENSLTLSLHETTTAPSETSGAATTTTVASSLSHGQDTPTLASNDNDDNEALWTAELDSRANVRDLIATCSILSREAKNHRGGGGGQGRFPHSTIILSLDVNLALEENKRADSNLYIYLCMYTIFKKELKKLLRFSFKM